MSPLNSINNNLNYASPATPTASNLTINSNTNTPQNTQAPPPQNTNPPNLNQQQVIYPPIPPTQKIQNYPIIAQQVLPFLLQKLGFPPNKKLSEITVDELPPALPTSRKEIRILQSNDPLLDEMIPNIKALRQSEQKGLGKIIAFENLQNNDVIVIFNQLGDLPLDQILQIAENSPLFNNKTNKFYPKDGLRLIANGLRMHELLHLETLKRVTGINVEAYRQGVSIVLGRGSDDKPLVSRIRNFGQTTYRHQKLFDRYNGLLQEFSTIKNTVQEIKNNNGQILDEATQVLRAVNKQDIASLNNKTISLINRLKDLLREAETLEMAAVAPKILEGSVFEGHSILSPADKDKYAIAKNLQADILQLVRDSQVLQNRIESA